MEGVQAALTGSPFHEVGPYRKGKQNMETKKLRLFDVICLAFASFFSIELVSSQASLGPSMVFCIIVFGGIYLLLHGLICAELGSTYPDQGGLYVWTDKAFGPKWAARSTWWYWANVISFVPCTLVTLIIVFQQVLGIELSTLTVTVLAIIGTWLSVGLCCMSLQESKIISNLGSIMKLVACLALIGGGIWWLTTNGSANEFTAETMIPTFDLNLLMLVPVYIYGLTGMDLISCNAGEMENPRRDVPRAMAVSGFVSILVYLLSAVAVLFVLPQGGIDEASGMIDALLVIYGGSKIAVGLITIALLMVYISYIFSWAIGGNSVALEAGEAGEFPKIFAKTNKAHAPVGPAVLMGIASTVLMLVYGFTAGSGSDLFWTLLAFTSIIFFFPYIVLSFVLIKLRKDDPEVERPFAIPGKVLPTVVAVIHAVLLTFAVIGFTIPPEGEDPMTYLIVVVGGVIITQIIGELVINHAAKTAAEEEE